MKGPDNLNSDVTIKPENGNPVPDKVTIVIDPISKPVEAIKWVGNTVVDVSKKAAKAIKKAFTPKKRR